MTMHDIAFSINIAGSDEVVQRVLCLAPPTRPSDERPPVMYGHFCLVPRVSVHDRYYCMYIYFSDMGTTFVQLHNANENN